MIVYDLSCDSGHRFEGWFASSDDFASQHQRGALCCPECGSIEIDKAPMAPAVAKKSNQGSSAKPSGPNADTSMANAPLPHDVVKQMERLAKAQARALKDSKYVGKHFAEQSRAMHYGEQSHEVIHGEASLKEAMDLVDEGVPVTPLPFPVAPPEKLN